MYVQMVVVVAAVAVWRSFPQGMRLRNLLTGTWETRVAVTAADDDEFAPSQAHIINAKHPKENV